MDVESTENDAAIALVLAGDVDQNWHPMSWIDTSPIVEAKKTTISSSTSSSSSNENGNNVEDLELYADIAMIMQIEEIVIAENRKNTKTEKELNFDQTRADMTKQLQPATNQDTITRVIGILVSICSRFNACQEKHQPLINQLRVVSVQILPLLKGLKNSPAKTKFNPTALAVGLVGNLINGKVNVDEIRQILPCLINLWQGSNDWFEFFEQIVYIFVALIVPASLLQNYIQPLLAKAAIA